MKIINGILFDFSNWLLIRRFDDKNRSPGRF